MSQQHKTRIAIYIVGALMGIAGFALSLMGWPLSVRLPLSMLLGGAVGFVMVQLNRH